MPSLQGGQDAHLCMSLGTSMAPDADQRATANYRPVCIPDSCHLSRLSVLVLAEREGPERKSQHLGAASYMYDGQSQRPISQQQHGLPASRIWLGRRAAFDIFHIAYMSVNEARRSRVLGKISRRLRHPSHDKMLRVSRQNGRPSDVWMGATKARTQRGIFSCRIHAPPIRQGKSLEIRYPQYDHDHSTAQTPSNKPTNQRQARNESSSYLSVIFSPLAPPPYLMRRTQTQLLHICVRCLPARVDRLCHLANLQTLCRCTRRAKVVSVLAHKPPFVDPHASCLAVSVWVSRTARKRLPRKPLRHNRQPQAQSGWVSSPLCFACQHEVGPILETGRWCFQVTHVLVPLCDTARPSSFGPTAPP